MAERYLMAVCAAFASFASAAIGLEPGERVEGNVYYSDVRWVKRVWGGEKNALVRRHALGEGRKFTGGRILVRPDRWIKGEAFVEVLGAKGAWQRVGAVEKGKFLDAPLPAAAFPCETLAVRFLGGENASYEQNGYALDLEFSGAPIWKTSSTNAFYMADSGEWLSPEVWTVDCLRKVPRFGAVPPKDSKARSLRVALAANETEAVQLVLSPKSDLRNVTVAAELDGGLEVEVLAVDWRRVTHPTDRSGATGFWPDPIRRQTDKGMPIPGGSNRAFWVRVYAPKGTPKGIYHGRVLVRGIGNGGEPCQFPLEVEVFGFELPDRMTCLTNFGFDTSKLKAARCDVDAFQNALNRHHMTRFGRCCPYKYVFDEPTTNQYPEVRALCEKSKREHPGLKRMVTEPPCRELEGYVDIWCPRTDNYSRAAAEAVRARGEDYWWYICCGPKTPYAGLFIDRPGTELRTWLWQTWAEKVTGVLIWHTHWWSRSRDDNGDGTFFYKDDAGLPIETVRAEAFRDGVEDYEYMAIHSRLSGRRYAVPASVSRSLMDFDRTGAGLRKERMRLARDIERMQSRFTGGVGQPAIAVSAVDPRYFADETGKTWIPIGCNICFDRSAKPSPEARKLYDGWMTNFAKNGGNFMRVWLSMPFVDVMPDKAGEFSSEATANLKWLVSRAEALGIRLKFTFENFRRPGDRTDEHPERGVISFRNPVYAPYAKTMRDVFTSKECFDVYLAKARHIAEAVGTSGALIAVELWNEINSVDGADLKELRCWSDRMLAELKRLFPGKMTLQNLGSFSETSGYQIYDWLAGQKGNAYMQVHRYLDPGAPMDICHGPMDVLCADAIRELHDRRPDLPAVLAETGATERNHVIYSHLYALDSEGMLLHDEIFAPFFAGSAGCGQPWHWDHQYISRHDLWRHFRLFARAVDGIDPAAEHFRPFHTETHRLRFWGLRGEKTTVVWLRDKRNTWMTEIETGRKPEPVVGETLPRCLHRASYNWYLPWEDRHLTVVTPAMPAFVRSAVLRIQSAD